MKKYFLAAALLFASSAMAQLIPNPAATYASSPAARLTTPSGQTVTITPQNITAGARPNNSLGGVTNMPPTVAFFVNYSALIPHRYGSSSLLIATNSSTDPGSAPQYVPAGGEFRTGCATSHMGRFDPLVYPGRNTAGHLHTFFGNSDLTGSLNDQTLGNLSTFGRSTCDGGIANRSAYWVPSLIDTTTGTPVAPTGNQVYYKADSQYRSDHPEYTKVPPPGLRMISGNPSATTGNGGSYHLRYFCSDGPFLDHIPTAAEIAANPTWCQVGKELVMQVGFPQCWDGIHLDSPGHQAHMAFQDGDYFYSGCPAEFPVAIPEITYLVHYSIDSFGGPTKIPNFRLSSDNYPLTSPGGYSGHGDWINGWNQEIMQTWVTNCLTTHSDCHQDVIDMRGVIPYRVLVQQ